MADNRVRDLVLCYKVAQALKGLKQEKKTEPGTLSTYNQRAKCALFQRRRIPMIQFASIEAGFEPGIGGIARLHGRNSLCLLYTSDAADDLLCVDLGGRRI